MYRLEYPLYKIALHRGFEFYMEYLVEPASHWIGLSLSLISSTGSFNKVFGESHRTKVCLKLKFQARKLKNTTIRGVRLCVSSWENEFLGTWAFEDLWTCEYLLIGGGPF